MNLRDLEYMVAVADMRHFGKASEQCNVSQPTLSMQIKKLEESLGVAIFERGGRQAMPTPVGAQLVAKARQVLRGADEIRELARAAQDPLAGEFRLGLFPTLAPYLLPLCVSAIHKALPRIRLLLVEEKTDRLLEQLAEGRLDAALLALPVEAEGLESEALFDDPFLLAVPRGHRLAERKRVRMEDVVNEPLLLLEEGHCLRAQALEVCRIAGAQEQHEFRATSLETLRHMVAAGVGITLIPRLAARADAAIAYIPFAEKDVSRRVGLVRRKSMPRGAAAAKLADIVRQRAGALQA